MWLKDGLLLVACLSLAQAGKFKVTREWNYLNFTWPSADVYQNAVSKGLYIPENNIMSGITHFEDYFYVTLPRMKSGVPATLARIPAGVVQDTAPVLEPFPSWEMNSLDDCNALQNVQNVEVDPKGQMWIIDGGKTETLNPTDTTRCAPKLVIFDIKKNMTTTAYTFPENVANPNSSFLYDIVVDNTDGGYAYITDNSRKDPGIIVFSVKDHHSWKIRHSKTMKADPTATTFRVKDTMVTDPINIAGIALGPKIHTSNDRIVVNEDREVFFSPLSSLHLYSINTSVLRNEMNGANDGEYQGDLQDLGLKASQSIGMLMDNQGVLYYSLLATYSIAMWDTHTPFQSGQKIIARDENFLEWPNAFTFDQTGNITVLVNRLNRFIYGKLDINEVNFRLITASVGGKSYLYDQEYDYKPETSPSSTTSTTPLNLPEPQMLPGTNQDPYMAPNPQPEPHVEPQPVEVQPEPTPEPTPEPEPTTDNTTADPVTNSEVMHTKDEVMLNDQPISDQPAPMDREGDHKHMDHGHMDHEHSSTDRNDAENEIASANAEMSREMEHGTGGTTKLIGSFVGVLFAFALFVM